MKIRRYLLRLCLALLVLVGVAAWLLLADLPAPQALSGRLAVPSLRFTDRSGRLLYEALPGDGRHAVVPLEAMPLACRQAAIATEDRHFYTHPGVDVSGIVRSLWINLRRGETLAGGSTITQQVARNLLLDAGERGERSLRRKLREAFLAWRLTQQFSKDEILAFYLNQTYYGGMAYGLEAAAQTFFARPAARLDLAQCALLAGLPQAPALYNPFTDPTAAAARRETVLGLMQAAGYIDADQAQAAARQPFDLAEAPYPMQAPHFVMLARAQVDRLFSPQQVYQAGGLVVRTTLDLDWQQQAEAAVQRHLADLAQDASGLGHNVNSAALVALDPANGQVLALVGSPDYFDAAHGGAINMALAGRQPGSALKPLIYAAALDPRSPQPWTPATVLMDVSSSFLTRQGQAYVPANYDLREHGPVPLRQALAASLNIPAVLSLQHVGLPNFIPLAQRMGLTSLDDAGAYDLSLALGGGEVRLLDLTAAYGVFANQGYQVQPLTVLEISDPSGRRLYTAPAAPQVRVLDERVAWLISDMLSDDAARQLGFGRHSMLQLDRPAAVKTGTTSNYHDNWTIGYTPNLVVGVWSGNTGYDPMRGVNGLSGAAPIWHQFMRAALAGQPVQPFVRPDGLVQSEVCLLSGLQVTPACPYSRREWFIAGTQPTQADNVHRQVVIDRRTGGLAGAQTPPDERQTLTVLDLPPEAYAWARANGLALLADLAPQQAADLAQGGRLPQGGSLRILTPADRSLYRLSAQVPLAEQKLLIRMAVPPGAPAVTLWVDDVAVAEIADPAQGYWWPLAAGEHRLWLQAGDVISPVITINVQN